MPPLYQGNQQITITPVSTKIKNLCAELLSLPAVINCKIFQGKKDYSPFYVMTKLEALLQFLHITRRLV